METSSSTKIDILKYLGFDTPADLRSYLHLRGFIQVLGLKSLVAAKRPCFSLKEFAKSCEIFVNTGEHYLHFRYDCMNQLEVAQIVKDLS